MPRTLTKEEYIEKAQAVHGDKYLYIEIVYEHSSKKIEITCFDHGPFWMVPALHLRGNGCPKCGYEKRSISLRMTNDIEQEQEMKDHGPCARWLEDTETRWLLVEMNE